jgi:hypothetical protein
MVSVMPQICIRGAPKRACQSSNCGGVTFLRIGHGAEASLTFALVGPLSEEHADRGGEERGQGGLVAYRLLDEAGGS